MHASSAAASGQRHMLGMTMSSGSRFLLQPTPARDSMDQICSSSEQILEMLEVVFSEASAVCVCVCARPEGASVLPLTVTDSTMLVGSVLLLFSPWFGFYSRHLSVARLKASLVSKRGDERKMTWLCSLPKHAFWDTNQGMTVREKTTCS